ncbi:MAG: sulfatase-like hydrolase/transferase [Porticoccaceae bacterium]
MEKKIHLNFVSYLSLVGLSAFIYVFLEWVFFITKPSVLSVMVLSEKISAIFITFFFLFSFGLAAQFFMYLISIGARRLGYGKLADYLLVFVASLICCAATFLLIDNFTYTMIGFASFSFSGVGKYVYMALIGYLIFFYCKHLANVNKLYESRVSKYAPLLVMVVFVVSAVFVLFSRQSLEAQAEYTNSSSAKPKINVLFLFADGIDASSMSLYGYARKTTPFLDSIKDELLIFENHFTNAAKTTGSVGSLLSGKYPSTTHLIYRPDVFLGRDIYEHFPGVLKSYGYQNADFSVRHYVDPVDLNLQGGFDEANGRALDADHGVMYELKSLYPAASIFGSEVADRIVGRILHVLGLRTMYNPFAIVTSPEAYEYKSLDRGRIDSLKNFIESAPGPFFAHVHLLGAHGPTFFSEVHEFAAGDQKSYWSRDHYDDAVLQYDKYIEEVVDFLKEQGLYEKTLLVINADHGFQWGISTPIPLVFHFPHKEKVGVRNYNTQRIDIPFSVLEYLGINPPKWMEGVSLFDEKRDSSSPIYIVNRAASSDVNGWRQVANPTAPFYTLGFVSAVYCDTIYHLNVSVKYHLSVEKIKNHMGDCGGKNQPKTKRIYYDIVEHLKARGYDTASLE